jgi:hypothetical protein
MTVSLKVGQRPCRGQHTQSTRQVGRHNPISPPRVCRSARGPALRIERMLCRIRSNRSSMPAIYGVICPVLPWASGIQRGCPSRRGILADYRYIWRDTLDLVQVIPVVTRVDKLDTTGTLGVSFLPLHPSSLNAVKLPSLPLQPIPPGITFFSVCGPSALASIDDSGFSARHPATTAAPRGCV